MARALKICAGIQKNSELAPFLDGIGAPSFKGNTFMQHSNDTVFPMAEMVFDARAAGDAALHRDFDESRFRAHLIMGKAYALGLIDLAIAAAALKSDLGPAGSEPGSAYGASLVRVAEELHAVCRAH